MRRPQTNTESRSRGGRAEKTDACDQAGEAFERFGT